MEINKEILDDVAKILFDEIFILNLEKNKIQFLKQNSKCLSSQKTEQTFKEFFGARNLKNYVKNPKEFKIKLSEKELEKLNNQNPLTEFVCKRKLAEGYFCYAKYYIIHKSEEQFYCLVRCEYKNSDNSELDIDAQCAKSMISLSEEVFWLYDIEKDVAQFSEKVVKMYNMPTKYLTFSASQLKLYFVSQDCYMQFSNLLKNVRKGNDDFEDVLKINITKGKVVYFLIKFKTVKDKEGNCVKAVGVAEDVTKKVLYQEHMTMQNEKLLDNDEAVLLATKCNLTQNTIDYLLDKNYNQKFGLYNFDDVSKLIHNSIVDDDSNNDFGFKGKQYYIDQFHKDNTYFYKDVRYRYNGKILWVGISYCLIQDPKTKDIFLLGKLYNIEKTKKQKLLLEERLCKDKKLDIFNENAFKSLTTEIFKNMNLESHAFLFFEISNYFELKDKKGEEFVENLILKVSNLLKHRFAKDSLLFKLSYNQFGCMFVSFENSSEIVTKVEDYLQNLKSMQIDDMNLANLDVVIGIVFSKMPLSDFSEYIEYGNTAIYFAKIEKEKYKVLDVDATEAIEYYNKGFSKEKFLDQIEHKICILNPDTCTVIWSNKAYKEYLGECSIESYKHNKCLLKKYPDCKNFLKTNIQEEIFYKLKSKNIIINRSFAIWNGKKVCLQVVYDNNRQKKNVGILDGKDLVMECLDICYNEPNVEEGIEKILTGITDFYDAGKCGLLVLNNETDEIEYKHLHYCDELKKKNTTAVGLKSMGMQGWLSNNKLTEPLFYDDVNNLRKSEPQKYGLLMGLGIKNIRIYPINIANNFVGYVTLSNVTQNADKFNVVEMLLPIINKYYGYNKMIGYIEKLKNFDLVTGFKNRKNYIKFVKEQKTAENTAILIINCYNTKALLNKKNIMWVESYIKEFANTLIEKIPENSEIFRIANDEFIVVLSDIEYLPYLDFKNDMEQFFYNKYCNTIYFGLSHSYNNNDFDKLMELAYKAMKENKSLQKLIPKEIIEEKSVIAEKLDAAIKNKWFSILLQPIIDVSNKKIIGGEILTRLAHPKYGEMMPSQFIPILEENYIIEKFDKYVLERACEIVRYWKDKYSIEIPLTVNMSIKSIYDDNVLEKFVAICNKHQVETKYICLEFNEKIKVENNIKLVNNLKQLSDAGFVLTVDNFGAENGDIRLISQNDIKIIKLDRNIVLSIENEEKAFTMIKAFVEVLKKLDVECVGENIETQKQFELVKELGCAYGQGFYLYSPLDIDDFRKLIKK